MNCQSKRTHIISGKIPRFIDFSSIVVKYPHLKDKNNFFTFLMEKKQTPNKTKKDND